jgi:hypothetical protein
MPSLGSHCGASISLPALSALALSPAPAAARAAGFPEGQNNARLFFKVTSVGRVGVIRAPR